MRKFIVSICVAMVATPVAAQSSLGIQGLDLRFGKMQDEAGTAQAELQSRLDVAITEVHGFQGDVAFADTENGLIGQLGAHLYMTPRSGQKYGVFASLSDVDGRTMTWGSIGAEGMLALSETTTMEARAGMGILDVDSLDYIFGDIAVAYALSDNIDVEAAATFAEFDEAAFRAISYDISLTVRYSADGAPWGAFASVSQSGLSGRGGQPGETRFGFGVTMSFGQAGGVAPQSRPYRSVDPVAPLVRRDLW
ncbi:hypothetical protein [Boseongicola aestuarii]|uniref:Porin domain-containing protein n=1 Tax=Boseongicola aestuarii TaxID=1470561 RepID=A0A238IW24_9RHOB|nr:hypothetical protein [Boseongicola aestuarii]SMX22231.1 hypothetical protein BOA8489_00322 [Boseongicola aestuarii]